MRRHHPDTLQHVQHQRHDGRSIVLTWTHVVYTTGAELCADSVSRSETEIRDRQTKTSVEAQDVLRLQVTVIDIQRMAVLDCVKQLQEYFLNKIVIAQITTMVEDLRKQVAVLAIVHNDIGVLWVLDDAVEGNNVGVRGGELVEGDLAHVQLALARSVALGRMGKAFDGIGDGLLRVDVHGSVDDTISTIAKYFYELK